MDVAITAICYYAVGFAFAYGESNSKFIGNANYFLIDSDDYILWFFQFVFAGTTATIVSGSVAERCRFRAYIWYTIVLTSFVYPVTSHWIWSPQGFFYGKVLDFAGSGAVHLLGGAAVRIFLATARVYAGVNRPYLLLFTEYILCSFFFCFLHLYDQIRRWPVVILLGLVSASLIVIRSRGK